MNKINEISLQEELLSFWLKGWPEYHIYPSDDYPAIMALVKEIAKYCKVEESQVEGHQRCCEALVKISEYCRNNYNWAKKNLHFYARAFQTLKNEMAAKKRMENIKAQNYNWKKKD